MPAEVIMPALGKVQRWLKQDGDPVAKGEPLLEVETDKVTVEIESPAAGTLTGLNVPEGAEVPVGTAIAVVLAEGEVAAPEPAGVATLVGDATPRHDKGSGVATPRHDNRRRLASPKARRLARERGVDLDAVTGSGPQGAVVTADIRSEPQKPASEQIAVSSVWRVMAERTTRAWQEVPQFVLSREVDASRLESWRATARRKPGCENVSHTDLLVKVCSEALRRHTRVNASWREGAIVPGAGVNIAIAVATDAGLVAPVVHRADTLDLAAISARRRELAEAARAGRLRPEDVQGGTFTISNLGMYGVDVFQAIVNAPQAAILAVGRIVERPVALNGEVVVRPVLTLS